MNRSLFLTAAFLTTALFGVDYDRVKPHAPTDYGKEGGSTYGPELTTPHVKNGKQVLIPELKGVILTDSRAHVSQEEMARAVGGAETLNIQVPGTLKSFKAMLTKQFLNRPLTKQGMIDLKREILLYYRRWGRPVVTIEIPEQKITEGVLQVVVIEGKLGKVTAEGNKYFKSSTLEKYIRLEEGQAIDSNTLITDLDWINRNPFRQVDVIYAPGEVAGTTDIRLLTLDRRPWRVYAGVDNTGFDETDNTRLFTGVNWGDVFGTDQILSLQFTCSPNVDRYWALTGNYTIPLPWRDLWVFYGGYSHVHGDMDTSGLDNSGYAAQASTRYNFILPNSPGFLQDLTLGFDYKRTDNNLEFGGNRVFRNSINLTQLVLGYNAAFDSDDFKTSMTVELFYSPGDWLPEQSNSDYQRVRYKAKSDYIYIRAAFAPILRLSKDFSFALTLRGQVASQNLLASEQYGLGGYNTVRGYKERAVNVDNAFLVSAELRSPSMGLMGRRLFKDMIQFLIFLDYAIGRDVRPMPFISKTQYLLGFGPGVRYEIAPYLSFRGDLGFKLKGVENDPDKGFRFHFALVASY
ncbi:MAG: ShlB/FhaC/HecB family hemolysin secretion/activation protein [Chlamydiia bacterium]|nr:ShlB/FhaC/HecB family hemolysin secretion/activation protein [Chlamydiia bacterium]